MELCDWSIDQFTNIVVYIRDHAFESLFPM